MGSGFGIVLRVRNGPRQDDYVKSLDYFHHPFLPNLWNWYATSIILTNLSSLSLVSSDSLGSVSVTFGSLRMPLRLSFSLGSLS